ncbi:hypothetical protein [Terrimonas sp.]|uniref:hypothetical protein n=1 Tax=Terrimonas sp. TaxID=1914338 RepID=UPI00198259DD|nr:hypothetical protein [Terrimonas sp.]
MLATQLVDEFISLERRFIQRDWEPAELDGGQFCEIAARILYHLDSGTLNYNKGHDECIKYFENDQVQHLLNRREVGHIAKVLQAIYKFRSQRGAVHISATYTPNHMDSKLIVESVRWCLNELLRIFWNADRDSVAKTIRELLQFDVPSVGVYGETILVQRTDLKPEEEVLVLLHFAGENGYNRTEIGKFVMASPAAITTNIQKLCSPSYRQVIQLKNGNYRLTDLGERRIRNELVDKLIIK